MELANRQYNATDQLNFAELSADYNPLHVDPVAARRTMFGQPLVHGVHLVLWALDQWSKTMSNMSVTGIEVRLLKPAFLGENISLSVVGSEDGLVTLSCSTGSAKLCVIKIQYGFSQGSKPIDTDWVPAQTTLSDQPADLAIDELSGLHGITPLVASSKETSRFFPNLLDLMGTQNVAALLGLTRLVGMDCPGLNSIFSSFEIDFTGDPGNELRWEVTKANPRMSLVDIAVTGGGVAGKLRVFYRPPPQPELSYEVIKAKVEPHSTKARRILIIGGSRGLGRITAMLLAAGGAEVAVSYRSAEAEAQALTEEIKSDAQSAHYIALDTADPEAAIKALADKNFIPDEIYYFATPHIFVRKKELFEQSLYEGFSDSYVSGMMRVVQAARKYNKDSLRIFLPSSEALDAPLAELFEYSIAKAAAEKLAELLPVFDPKIAVIAKRLPRLPTDQTRTLMEVPSADPLKTMAEICDLMAPPNNI